jgi:hypothetical protein
VDQPITTAEPPFVDPPARLVPNRTSAVQVDEVESEIRRRVVLYRGAARGDNPAKADALEALLWWVEAQRR